MRIILMFTAFSLSIFSCFASEDYEESHLESAEDIYYGLEYTLENDEIRAQVIIENQSNDDVMVQLSDRDFLSGIEIWQGDEMVISEPEDALVEMGDQIRIDSGERETGSSIIFNFNPNESYVVRSERIIYNIDRIENGIHENVEIEVETVEFEINAN